MLHRNIGSDLFESTNFIYKYLKYALCSVQLTL